LSNSPTAYLFDREYKKPIKSLQPRGSLKQDVYGTKLFGKLYPGNPRIS